MVGISSQFNQATTSALKLNTSITQQLQKTQERLSSGLRIKTAADDPAGLAVATRMLSQLNGMNQSTRNSMDGLSMTEVAESAFTNVNSDLQRMRELSVQAANGTLTDSDRQALNAEFGQLQTNISNTLQSTDFNGQKLLSEDGTTTVQSGGNASQDQQITISRVDMTANNAQGIGEALDTSAFNISSPGGAQNAISRLDEMINRVSTNRSDFGALANRLDSNMRNQMDNFVATSASKSRIADADMARESTGLSKALIQQQANMAMLGQAKGMMPAMVQSLLRG